MAYSTTAIEKALDSALTRLGYLTPSGTDVILDKLYDFWYLRADRYPI